MKKNLFNIFLVIAIIATLSVTYSTSTARGNTAFQLAFSEIDLANIALACLEHHRRLKNRLYDSVLSVSASIVSTLLGDLPLPDMKMLA